MSRKSVEKWIDVKLTGQSPSGITLRWSVFNTRTNELVGQVKWHGAFRKYCFFPSEGFLFDADCLRLVADIIEGATIGHSEAKRRTAV